MKTLKLTEVLDAISQYCENHQGKKPMMLWFHSNPDVDEVKRVINNTPSYATFIGHPLKLGNKYMILNDEVAKITDHKELLDEFIFPSTYQIEATKLFVYHTYLGQLNKEALQYCVDIVNIGQYPVVCLMNDYSLKVDKPSEEVLSFVETHFDQYDVNK